MKQIPPHPKVLKLMARAAKRRERFQSLKDAGWSYAKIGKRFSISWQRVQQILNPGKRP